MTMILGLVVFSVLLVYRCRAAFSAAQQEVEILPATDVSYVMEPFEFIDMDWLSINANLSLSSDALFGNHSVEATAAAPADNLGAVSFGWIMAERPHNCYGAHYLSLWYKILPLTSTGLAGNPRLRLYLYDDTDCVRQRTSAARCTDPANLKEYTMLDEPLNPTGGAIASSPGDWQRVQIPLVGFAELNTRRIRGWRIEVAQPNNSSNKTSFPQTNATRQKPSGLIPAVQFDQLACVGGGDLFGSMFYIGSPVVTFQEAVAEGSWEAHYYESNISERDTSSSLIDGVLAVNYTVEMVEDSGGFVDYAYLAPGSAYYNLSQATDIMLDYTVSRTSSRPGRAIFRLVLQDNSNCNQTCDTDYHSQERYYSFFSILDTNSSDGQLVIALNASTTQAVPFYLPGWSGILGNEHLDITNLKGFTFELVLDSVLKVGDLVTGSVTFSNLQAVETTPLPEGYVEMSYVMEPFESMNQDWFLPMASDNSTKESLQLTISQQSLFGNYSLQVDYVVSDQSPSAGSVSFGWILADRPHNCYGASRVSLWYKIPDADRMKGAGRLRLILLDDSACEMSNMSLVNRSLCADPDNLTPFVAIDAPLVVVDSKTDWLELSKPILSDMIDPRRIRGWMVQIMHDIQDEPSINISSASGTLLLDQLACVGGGDMFGAAFHIEPSFSFQRSIAEDSWMAHYYESNISQRQTSSSMVDGVLSINYTLQMVEDWGGFVDFVHLAPGAAYYNLSTLATDIVLDYVIAKASSRPGRAIMRFVLQDNSNCNETCDTDYHSQERYYSFFSILDTNSSSPVTGRLVIALNASTDSAVPFWLTGWSGILGNEHLDITNLKGFTFELVLDSVLKIGDLVLGSVAFKDLAAVALDTNITHNDTAAKCVMESGLYFNVSATQFTRVEFFSTECCDRCAGQPDCLFALSDGRDCYLAPYLAAEDVGVLNSELEISSLTAVWMDDIAKRGNYCKICDCNQDSLSIDCRGRDLAIIPKEFDELWAPRKLDLRDNPRLTLLGSGELASIAANLEEVWLPANISFISNTSLVDVPSNVSVYFEAREEYGNTVDNAIIDPHDAFGDICCTRGQHIHLIEPPTGLTFCDMQPDSPGIDVVYLPFVNFFDATTYLALDPTSSFMAEASQSAEKCAQYCAIVQQCNYFTYDNRLPNAVPVCLLEEDNGTRQERVCCTPDEYADVNKTKPGYTSGRPPSTRRVIDNATVWSAPQKLVANPENQYTAQYTLVLGSTPLRGAVWIEPMLASPVTGMNISISPWRAVLYDANMSVTVNVTVSGLTSASTGMTLVITNMILSCDVAFVPSVANNLFLDVVVPPGSNSHLAAAIAVPVAVVVLVAFGLYAFFEHQRRSNDAIWRIKLNELHFASPPDVIGRGTFGLVLLGEYRGTQVAVKRAVPPRSRKKDGSNSSSDQIDAPFRAAFDETAPAGEARIDHSHSTTDDYSTSRSNERKSVDASLGMTSWGRLSLGSQQGGLNSSLNRSKKSFHTARFSLWSSVNDASLQRTLRADFVEEMRYLSKLRHPCITTVMGAVIDKNVEPMLVMEYMDHGSLYDMLHNETMILEGEVILPILRDVTKGVRFLHAANPQVIHGDLKAQNILVDSKLRAKVADFGLSQKRNLGGTGTPFWMSPELLRGETKNTTASDIYSFGIILYEAFSRRDPYEGEDAKEVLRLVTDKAVNKRPPAPASSPPQVQSLMADCLQGDPAARPNAEEVDSRLLRIDLKNMDIYHGGLRAKKSAVSLFDIFPRHVAEALRDGKQVEPEHRDMVTIFFSDIVGFTTISSALDPRKVAAMLDRLYLRLDELSRKHDVFKVETIGDAYMAVTNLVSEQATDHCRRIAAFALDAVQAANETLIDMDDPSLGVVNIRVGFHSGPVVADVVGNRNPRYCLFGDTVNVASRMESNSKENRIHCSARSAELLRVQWPELALFSRGEIVIKGKGLMHTYWVNENVRRKSSFMDAEFLSMAAGRSTRQMMIEAVKEEDGYTEGESEGFTNDKLDQQDGVSEELEVVRDKLIGRLSRYTGNDDKTSSEIAVEPQTSSMCMHKEVEPVKEERVVTDANKLNDDDQELESGASKLNDDTGRAVDSLV